MDDLLKPRYTWADKVKDRADMLYACWAKFLFDKYCGQRLFMDGYDAAYDEALRAVVHMQRATSPRIRIGLVYLIPDIWPVERDGVIGVELSLSMKTRLKGGRSLRVTDIRVYDNTITIVTDNTTMTYRYMTNLEKVYTSFLELYRNREIMVDDSQMTMELTLDD